MNLRNRIISLLLLTLLLIGALAVPVAAVDRTYTFYGTVGKTEYFIMFSDAYDEILEATIYNGVIPGMSLDVAGGATLGLVGVPTTDGEFSVFITLKTKNLGTIDIKATVYLNPAPPSGTPEITKNPTGETVVEGDSATFIARADHVRQYHWEIAIADACIDCADLESYIGRGVKVSGWDTDTLVISNIPKELNGAYVWCQFVGAEDSVDSAAAMITVTAQKDATPVVTKHPTEETVEEGGEAIFVAKAKYAQSYLWQLVSPNGTVYNCTDAPGQFPGLRISGADTERIVLSNIPLELDGYRIFCKFTAGSMVSSDKASIHVNAKATEPTETEPTETQPPETHPQQTTPPATEPPAVQPGATEPIFGPGGTMTEPPQNMDNGGGNNNSTVILAAIIGISVIAVAAITAFVILKLKGVSQK